MEQSLADMLKEKEELDHAMLLLDALPKIIERVPGAETLADVERVTGKAAIDLLAEETGLTVEQVAAADARMAANESSEPAG